MRPPLLPLLLLFAACTGAPTSPPPRPLSAPIAAAAAMFDRWLGPAAIARDVGAVRDRASALAGNELDFGSAGRTLRLFAAEPERLPQLRTALAALATGEVERLGALRHSRAFARFDPMADCLQLGADLQALPELLQLDRRPLGEADDRQHRIDPDDRRPEAGWSARLLRRLFP